VKNRDLLDATESINAVAALKQPVRTSFCIALNLKAIRDHLEVYETQRKKLVAAHAKKDKDGKNLPAYFPAEDKDGKSIFDKDGEPIPNAVDRDGNPPKVNPNGVRLNNPQAFHDEYKELLELDVTDELVIRPVKLSLLEGSIEPQHLSGITWMINDDVSDPLPAKPKSGK
jgi:hypothetical protein